MEIVRKEFKEAEDRLDSLKLEAEHQIDILNATNESVRVLNKITNLIRFCIVNIVLYST